MAVKVETVNSITKYVTEDGKLTIEGIRLLQTIVEALADHETRLVVLEP